MKKTLIISITAICFLLISQSRLMANRLDIIEDCEKIISSLQDGTSRSDFEKYLTQISNHIDDYYQFSPENTLFLEYAFDFYQRSKSILNRFEDQDRKHIFIQENEKNIRMGIKKSKTKSDKIKPGIKFSESQNSVSMQLHSRSSQQLSPTQDLYRQAYQLLNHMYLFIDVAP